MSTRDKIDTSEVFLVLGTENYVRSLRDPTDSEHHLITEQVITARHLCKPIVLLIDQLMEQEDKDYLKKYFKNFSVIEEFPINSADENSLREAVSRLVELLERDK